MSVVKKIKNKKSPQANIPNSIPTNKYKPLYMIDFRKQLHLDKDSRLKEDHLQFLANLLEQWVEEDPTAIDLKTFRRWHHFSDYSNFNALVKRYEPLYKAFKFAKLSIAENRERLALYKEIEPKIFALMQHNYDPEWGSAEERLYKLKAVIDSNAITKEDLNHLLKDILKPV